jgi:hypothetical protein
MGLTRSQAKAAFNHVLDNVFDRDDIAPLRQALKAQTVEDICSLCSMHDCDIDDLVYNKSDTETNVPVKWFERKLVKIFISYVGYARSNGNDLSDNNEWGAITREDFDKYRTSPAYNSLMRQSSDTTPTATTAPGSTEAVTPVASRNPAELFRRGIKRDSTLFPTLKDE